MALELLEAGSLCMARAARRGEAGANGELACTSYAAGVGAVQQRMRKVPATRTGVEPGAHLYCSTRTSNVWWLSNPPTSPSE